MHAHRYQHTSMPYTIVSLVKYKSCYIWQYTICACTCILHSGIVGVSKSQGKPRSQQQNSSSSSSTRKLNINIYESQPHRPTVIHNPKAHPNIQLENGVTIYTSICNWNIEFLRKPLKFLGRSKVWHTTISDTVYGIRCIFKIQIQIMHLLRMKSANVYLC